MKFGPPKVPYFGPFLERFRPENCKKGPIFFARFARQDFKISEVLINSSVRFSYFSEVLSSKGGVINSITVVVSPILYPPASLGGVLLIVVFNADKG